MVDTLNEFTYVWWHWMFSMFWQVGVLIVLIGIIDLLIRKWVWPQLRYALWLLVLVKLILPPSLTSPTSLTSNLQPLAKDALAAQIQKSEPTEVADPGSYPLPKPVLEYEPITEPLPLIVQMPQTQPIVGENPPFETVDSSIAKEPTAPEAGTVAPKVKLHWKFYLMLVWSLGMWILTGWFILHWRQLIRQVRKPSTTDTLPDWFFDSLRETADLLGLRRIPRVAVSSKIATPAVFGLFRPTLLMPTANLDKLSRRDARHVLLHELAHIKRRDPLVHTFNLLLQIVYWFNPLLWLVRRQLQHLRELCCDATVAKILKENTMAYRETLLETAKRLLAKPVEPGLGLLGLFENSNRLVTRLKWLEKKTWKHSRIRFTVIVLVIAAVSACVLPMAQGEKTANENKSAELVSETESEEREANGEGAAEAQKAKNQFTATLPNGVTVTLEGICENPQTGPWWRPNGERWEQSPKLRKYMVDPDRPEVREEFYKAYEMFVSVNTQGRRCPGRGQMPERWQIPQGRVGPGRKAPFEIFVGGGGMLANTAILSEDLHQTNVRFALALGPWKTRIAIPPHEDLHYRFPLEVPDAGMTFYKSSQEETDSEGNKHTSIDVVVEDWQKTPLAYRVIAALKDGNVREDVYLSPHDTPLRQVQKGLLTYIFHRLPQKEIDHFELQSSPMQWVEFQNVSLQPDHKTKVQTVQMQMNPEDKNRLRLQIQNMSVKKLPEFITAFTGKTVIMSDDRVGDQSITIYSQQEITKDQALELIRNALKLKQIQLEERNGILYLGSQSLPPAVAATPPTFPKPQALQEVSISANDKAVMDKLSKTLVSVDYQEVELIEVFANLQNTYNLNLCPLWGSLETAAGINQDDVITLKLDNVPLQKVLDSVLASVSAGKYALAKYMIDMGVITIAAEKELLGRFQVQPIQPSSQEPLDLVSTQSSLSSSAYQSDRPWKWYVVMRDLNEWRKKKNDMESQLKSRILERQQVLETKEKDHPDSKKLDEIIFFYQQQHLHAQQKYKEASMKMRDLEEKMGQFQEVTNQLRFLQQQHQKLEQRILDTRIEYESAESVQEQNKAETLLPALQKQREIIEQKLQQKQELLKALRRQMN